VALAVLGVVLLLLIAGLVWALAGPAATTASPAGGGGTGGAAARAESIDAVLEAARLYVTDNQPAKAEAVLASAIGQYADDVSLRLAMSEVMLLLGRGEEAYAQFEAALALDPNQPEVHFSAGTLASTIGRGDRAVEHYSMARTADPNQARYALYLAAAQLQAGDADEAKVNFLHALHLDAQSATAAAALAQIAMQENERELALSYARRAREIEPGELAYTVLEARALRRLGRVEEALGMILALEPPDLHLPAVLELAGECLGLLRRPGEAADLYQAAAEATPTDAEVAFQAALWNERAERADAARRLALRAQMLGHPQAQAMVERLDRGG
jgi:tetratricopeptide (TPR) repeat protein